MSGKPLPCTLFQRLSFTGYILPPRGLHMRSRSLQPSLASDLRCFVSSRPAGDGRSARHVQGRSNVVDRRLPRGRLPFLDLFVVLEMANQQHCHTRTHNNAPDSGIRGSIPTGLATCPGFGFGPHTPPPLGAPVRPPSLSLSHSTLRGTMGAPEEGRLSIRKLHLDQVLGLYIWHIPSWSLMANSSLGSWKNTRNILT